MGCEGAIIHRDLENREGRSPKPLGFLVILGLRSGYAAVAVLKRRGGRKRGDFRGGAVRLKRFTLLQ